MFKLNGTPLAVDTAFTTEDGTSYPSNWLRLASPEERAAIGITEEADPATYDDRFYWGIGNPKLLNDREESDEQGNPLFVKVLGEVDGQPAMVDSDKRLVTKGLKSLWVSNFKQTAGTLLSASDWMIVRKYERKVAIPEPVVTYRAAVIAEANRLESDVGAAASVEELIAVVNSQSWPVSE